MGSRRMAGKYGKFCWRIRESDGKGHGREGIDIGGEAWRM